MSPETALREADEAGGSLATEYIRRVTGRTNEFSIARPSDRLRNRLLLEQNLSEDIAEKLRTSLANGASREPLPSPLVLTLTDAMRIGVENAEEYQLKKESLFAKALALDLSRNEFENTFASALGLAASRSEDDDGETGRISGETKQGITRKLKSGATFAASIGLDLIRFLTGGDSTMGFSSGVSFSLPLFRGSGRKIATEALTQSERDLLYAVHEFEAYREEFAMRIATKYYEMLSVEQQVQALRDNSGRLSANYERAQLLYDAGRLSQIELDQTRQEMLNTDNRLVDAEKAMQSRLDSFKMSLGLPVDALVCLDMRELELLREKMGLGTDNDIAQQPTLPWTGEEAVAIALTNRTELILTKYRLEDSRRKLDLARDGLRFGAQLKLGGDFGKRKVSGGDSSETIAYTASIDSDLPWDKTQERNAYRMALISMDAAERAYDQMKDATRQIIRDDIRNINTAWSSYVIQSEALTVAQRRVRSTTLFQQAGKSSTRDLLEAESSLLSARNSVVAAIVDYRMAGLKLKQDMSVLSITEEGLLLED